MLKKLCKVIPLMFIMALLLTTAVFAADHTVTFNPNGGTLTNMSPQTVTNGGTIAESNLTAPTYEGHTFLGWKVGDTWFTSTTPVNDDITVTAQWETTKYTVTFTSEGSTLSTQSVEYNTSPTWPTVPTRSGYLFKSWKNTSDNKEYTSATSFDSLKIKEATELQAQWVAGTVEMVKVTFNANGSTFDGTKKKISKNVEKNKPLSANLVSDPRFTTKLSFSYWSATKPSKNTDTSVPKYVFGVNNITEDTELYAVYEESDNKDQFCKVKFDPNNDDGEIKSVLVYPGDKVSKPDTPDYKNHKFKGWSDTKHDADSTSNSSVEYYDFDDSVTNDMTLYAVWRKYTDEEIAEQAKEKEAAAAAASANQVQAAQAAQQAQQQANAQQVADAIASMVTSLPKTGVDPSAAMAIPATATVCFGGLSIWWGTRRKKKHDKDEENKDNENNTKDI